MIYFYDSPLGSISYEWDGAICLHVWLDKHAAAVGENENPVSLWLDAYFNAESRELPALAKPATGFQAKMREGLVNIPAGEVRTYGDIAKELYTSPRAMGQALGANPLPILIPCHRVIAADGLGGFACGLEWKKKLLKFERGF
ncbi:methylated-DNA-[protein]-cysteine S-methyltransferase [Mariprofundus micogutta]|uniref:Methylated-DNA-[protein]-cysteine S-methyltransferase n=1 Tax=Mariprofundus micogutta TaxID=1921010 RepID=A0A1L8CMN9_9PROT|nr:methylated-DNA--[protein]-cysteine S-methyltransferase [Mariprofundus micogutta]GAV20190.1 methylated-DNA-[protein]-cysteine S-methyltransferase [Mariprofundus micogutta]